MCTLSLRRPFGRATLAALALVLTLSLALPGCAPRKPRSFEEQALADAREHCREGATSMSDPPHNSMNPLWDSYFTMCMTKFGYGRKEIREGWQ